METFQEKARVCCNCSYHSYEKSTSRRITNYCREYDKNWLGDNNEVTCYLHSFKLSILEDE